MRGVPFCTWCWFLSHIVLHMGLGLYKSGSYYVTELDQEGNKTVDGNRTSSRQMMMPLRLCADLPVSPDEILHDSPKQKCGMSRSLSIEVPIEQFRLDAPAWLEMMHRSKRQVQRVYVVRMIKDHIAPDELSSSGEELPLASVRLRTGKDLTPLLRLGLVSETNSCDHRDEDRCVPLCLII